ncbi:MAG: hypothetical protein BMS9Abin13_393 [Patescibacteria group bacterium]|nr:MAG: hypothetical protein BMS9Abin13_393 [Patescibacteria group bacterium]
MNVLMCLPRFICIDRTINAWMDKKYQPDLEVAQKQWHHVVKTYANADIQIWFIQPEKGCQDMCFTANAGWYYQGKIILSSFKGKVARARGPEIPCYGEWFRKYRSRLGGIKVISFPRSDVSFEGQGDIVVVGAGGDRKHDVVLMGYGQGRTNYAAAKILREIHDLPEDRLIPIRLVNKKFYHLDTACLFIPPNMLLYYPGAFDEKGLGILDALGLHMISVSEKDAENLVCNGVAVEECGETLLIANRTSVELKTRLQKHGIRVAEVNTSEFLKNGGSVRCLTLFLPEKK